MPAKELSFPDMDYQLLDNGIHLHIFKKSTRAAIDSWISMAETLINETTPNDTVCVLYDLSASGMLPLSYGTQRLSELTKKYPKRSKTRGAFVIPPSFLSSLIVAFSRLLHLDREEMRFFPIARRDEAVAWLLEGVRQAPAPIAKEMQ
ncbi:MAG: STAS/SEC14 domain-containing protein [Anaerolineae bacterium]|nr:STAS/SEC14 domain-containing protein [Anaerolineae bacterium]